MPKSLAEKEWKVKLPGGDIFVELTEFHEYPYKPVFHYHEELPKRLNKSNVNKNDDGELVPKYWQTVILHDLSLEFENGKVGPLAIPAELKSKLTGLNEIFYITPMKNRFVLNKWLEDYEILTGTLIAEKEHSVVYGKDAILISEELYFKSKGK